MNHGIYCAHQLDGILPDSNQPALTGISETINARKGIHTMAKNTQSNKLATVPTMASIIAAREAIAQQQAALDAQEVAVKENTLTRIREICDQALIDVKAVYGETANMGLLAGWMKTHAAGNLVSLSTGSSGANGDKGKRLSDEQKLALRNDLLKRALALKAGGTAEQLSVIQARYDVSSSTADNYKPSEAEIAAGVLTVAAPAPTA
jgi:hypothetical protein